MREVLHIPFHGPSRFVRLLLGEKALPARLTPVGALALEAAAEDVIATRNPAMTAPVLIDQTPLGEEAIICPATSVMEFLEETAPRPTLMPGTAAGRGEARRLVAWFTDKFAADVDAPLLSDRLEPNATSRQSGIEALAWHLDYLDWLLERRANLAGERQTVADFAAAAHLSVHDYFNDIPWETAPNVKAWYQRLKCRPSFRPLLEDRLASRPPALCYADLDF